MEKQEFMQLIGLCRKNKIHQFKIESKYINEEFIKQVIIPNFYGNFYFSQNTNSEYSYYEFDIILNNHG